MQRILVPGVIFCTLIGFATLLWLDSARQAHGPSLIGRPAPLDHPLIGQGHPLLINFWFSTCAPCRAEHPVLMDMAGSGGLDLIGINRDVSAADASAFLEDLGDPFAAHIHDPADRIAERFAVEVWPTSFLVAGNGVVQAIYGPLIDPGVQAHMALIAAPEVLFSDPALEAQAQALFGLINCLDCEANTVRESGGDFALQMRKLVRVWLRDGWDHAQVRDTLIARYGPKIWLDPPLNATTAIFYLLPFLVLIGGGALVFRRRQDA